MPHVMIYLASPYSHPCSDVEVARFEAASRAAGIYLRRGDLVYSPIAHGHPIGAHGGHDGSYEVWKRHSRAMIDRCDALHVLMLPRWRESTGVADEVPYAADQDMSITYVCPYEIGALSHT